MGKINRLSRRMDWKVDIEKDNKNQVFIKDCWLHNLYEVVIVEKIKKARGKNEKIVRVVEKMKKTRVKRL